MEESRGQPPEHKPAGPTRQREGTGEGQENRRGKQEGEGTGGAITSRRGTGSGPVGGLGLFKPTCPALGSGPAENQQETDGEDSGRKVSLTNTNDK